MPQNADAAREAARRPDGKFGEQARAEDTSVTLTAPATPPLTPRDVAHLIEHKGCFEDGYDDDTINKVLGGFESANLVCVWDYFDDAGYGGNSEIVGIGQAPIGPTAQGDRAWVDVGTWRRLHPDTWAFLSDPETDIDPESIPSLLDTNGDFAVYEIQNIDELPGDGFRNVAAEYDDTDSTEADACTHCGEALDDGEGCDGYCGTCADLIEQHNDTDDEDSGHATPERDCPNCNGARVTWS